jgi:hypothetical protein
VFKLVHGWLRDERNGRWLFVLDNADDAAVLSLTDDGSSSSSALQQHLSRYLPSSRHGSVLVTSRTKLAAMQVVEDRFRGDDGVGSKGGRFGSETKSLA